MFAATEVTAITATPSPTCRLRADAKKEPTAAITMRTLHGLTRPTMPLLEIVAQRLDRHVRDPEAEPGRRAQQNAVLRPHPLDPVGEDQE